MHAFNKQLINSSMFVFFLPPLILMLTFFFFWFFFLIFDFLPLPWNWKSYVPLIILVIFVSVLCNPALPSSAVSCLYLYCQGIHLEVSFPFSVRILFLVLNPARSLTTQFQGLHLSSMNDCTGQLPIKWIFVSWGLWLLSDVTSYHINSFTFLKLVFIINRYKVKLEGHSVECIPPPRNAWSTRTYRAQFIFEISFYTGLYRFWPNRSMMKNHVKN